MVVFLKEIKTPVKGSSWPGQVFRCYGGGRLSHLVLSWFPFRLHSFRLHSLFVNLQIVVSRVYKKREKKNIPGARDASSRALVCFRCESVWQWYSCCCRRAEELNHSHVIRSLKRTQSQQRVKNQLELERYQPGSDRPGRGGRPQGQGREMLVGARGANTFRAPRYVFFYFLNFFDILNVHLLLATCTERKITSTTNSHYHQHCTPTAIPGPKKSAHQQQQQRRYTGSKHAYVYLKVCNFLYLFFCSTNDLPFDYGVQSVNHGGETKLHHQHQDTERVDYEWRRQGR